MEGKARRTARAGRCGRDRCDRAAACQREPTPRRGGVPLPTADAGLVNAAYAYLLAERRLPREEGAATPEPGHRALSPAQRERIRSSLAVMRVSTADPNDPQTFEEQLNDARSERYAAYLG